MLIRFIDLKFIVIGKNTLYIICSYFSKLFIKILFVMGWPCGYSTSNILFISSILVCALGANLVRFLGFVISFMLLFTSVVNNVFSFINLSGKKGAQYLDIAFKVIVGANAVKSLASGGGNNNKDDNKKDDNKKDDSKKDNNQNKGDNSNNESSNSK